MTTVYQDHGYKNRRDYLECLADDYSVDKEVVFALASMLGETEDFDGLVTSIEDYSNEIN